MTELTKRFDEDLSAAGKYHGHLCTGQYIGVRMARRGCMELNIADPKNCRDLFVFVEIDRCLADAVSAVTGCKPGRRRFKHVDYGKSAAVFLNNATGEAVRLASRDWVQTEPGDDLREVFAMLRDEDLFTIERVAIRIPEEDLPGRPVERVRCVRCREYVTDRRHIEADGETLCRACALGAYYVRPGEEDVAEEPFDGEESPAAEETGEKVPPEAEVPAPEEAPGEDSAGES